MYSVALNHNTLNEAGESNKKASEMMPAVMLFEIPLYLKKL